MVTGNELSLDEFERECDAQGLDLDSLAEQMVVAGKAAAVLGRTELAKRCLKFLTDISDESALIVMDDVLLLIQDCKRALLDVQHIQQSH